VNNRDRNFTDAKIERRMEQIEQSIERYLAAMDTADRTQSEVAEPKAVRRLITASAGNKDQAPRTQLPLASRGHQRLVSAVADIRGPIPTGSTPFCSGDSRFGIEAPLLAPRV